MTEVRNLVKGFYIAYSVGYWNVYGNEISLNVVFLMQKVFSSQGYGLYLVLDCCIRKVNNKDVFLVV